jgi:hypothetical protein
MNLKEVVEIIGIKELINQVWDDVEEIVNENSKIISSEKAIVFHFAWLINSNNIYKIKNIDFEKVIFENNFSDGKYLDLFFEIEVENLNFKVGVEFKYPNKKKNNSGQT